MRLSVYSRTSPPASAPRAGARQPRSMARRPRPPARGWVALACLSAAAFALLLLALGVAYWHQDTPGSEATCAICHVAHLTPLPGSVVAPISAPLLVGWYESAEAQLEQASPPLTDAPPRAPPAS
jgi:hypothetical protein